MKGKEGFCVGYNVESGVDGERDMIGGLVVRKSGREDGEVRRVGCEVKGDYGVEVVE